MKFTVYEFALMSRFIELGKRYGLEPWELSIEYDRSTGETYVPGEPASRDAYVRFREMMNALGVPKGQSAIPYEEGEEMFNVLDKAIKNAPRKWAR